MATLCVAMETQDWSTDVIRDGSGSIVRFFPRFLTMEEANSLLSELAAERATFNRDELVIMGKKVLSPRKVRAFGDPHLIYTYAGMDRPTTGWLPSLERVRDKIAKIAGHSYNYALVNHYHDGNDYIGWHSDKEADIVVPSFIASVSLGCERPFYFAHRTNNQQIKLRLPHGSLLLMNMTSQKHYKHTLPKVSNLTQERYNITFRAIRDRNK